MKKLTNCPHCNGSGTVPICVECGEIADTACDVCGDRICYEHQGGSDCEGVAFCMRCWPEVEAEFEAQASREEAAPP